MRCDDDNLHAGASDEFRFGDGSDAHPIIVEDDKGRCNAGSTTITSFHLVFETGFRTANLSLSALFPRSYRDVDFDRCHVT